MPRQKLKLLLLDADVIILAHELGIWDRLVKTCKISVTETVIDEANMWFDEDEGSHQIDLAPLVKKGDVECVAVPLSEVLRFRKRFNLVYLDGMDPGETESLTLLESSDEKWMFCSGDAISFKILGCLAKGDQGVSLEEVLQTCGLSISGAKDLGHHTKAYREKFTRKGEQDGFMGMAFSEA